MNENLPWEESEEFANMTIQRQGDEHSRKATTRSIVTEGLHLPKRFLVGFCRSTSSLRGPS